MATRSSSAGLALLVLLIVLLPGFAACSSGVPSVTINPPDCSTVPGMAQAPAQPKPLPALAPPIMSGAEVGTMPGAGKVAAASGEYQYRIPIDVPEGRAGTEPSIALAYSSRGGNGHVGLGWQLDGFSAIERCPKTFATEGLADGVHLDAHDAFCLDGHKLVAIQGSYGGDGTEYRTEDELFARIVSTAADREITQFTVWTKAGTIRSYLPVETPKTVSDKARKLAWLLHEETDRSGNAVRYSYEVRPRKEGPPDHSYEIPIIEYYPAQIDYTIQTKKNPEEPGLRSVKLIYEDRPDRPFAILDKVRVETSRRLKEIQAYAPNPTAPGMVWSYALSYDKSPGSGVSRLTRIQRCGALGGCQNAKTFQWESTSGPTYAVETYPGLSFLHPPIVGDLNGKEVVAYRCACSSASTQVA